ncbi:MAG TPA: NAD(+)/NADH kinase [Planctomycetes bacterium]|nr:NAD(+)/NADH kinase [Planctomycetota bacterium]HIN79930.1 NAD(+)/NADH kinase [Planctomycetota bacterium]
MQIERILIAMPEPPAEVLSFLPEVEKALASQGVASTAWRGNHTDQPPDPNNFDRVIVMGGDGALMGVLRALDFPTVPFYGVNYGRVGFLMNPRSSATELVSRLIEGDCIEQKIPVLKAIFTIEDGNKGEICAINDIVLERDSGQTVHLSTYIDEELLNAYSGDGIIIATPAGSTAYSLAACGPVVHPDVEAMVVTPLYAHRPVQFHSLQFPIVLPLTSRIRVVPENLNKRPLRLVADGVTVAGVVSVDVIDRGVPVNLLRPDDYGYIDSLVTRIIGRERSFDRDADEVEDSTQGP